MTRDELTAFVVEQAEQVGLDVERLPSFHFVGDVLLDGRWLVELTAVYNNAVTIPTPQWVFREWESFEVLWAWYEDGEVWCATSAELAERPNAIWVARDGREFQRFEVLGWKPQTLVAKTLPDRWLISIPFALSPNGPMQITLDGGEVPMESATVVGSRESLILKWMRDGLCPKSWQVGVIYHLFSESPCGSYARDHKYETYDGEACCREAADVDGSQIAKQLERKGVIWKADDGRWRLIGRDARAEDGERWDEVVRDMVKLSRRSARAAVDAPKEEMLWV